MEMEKIYFLLFVAVCAAVLVLLVWRGERKHGARTKARRKQLKNKPHVHYRREPGRLQSVHGHAVSRLKNGVDAWAWEARKKHAGEEIRDGTAFAASRLYSDEEKSRKGADEDLAMAAIEYTAEDEPKRPVRARR